VITFLRRWYLAHFRLHDEAWKPTGLRFLTARTYDYELAKAGALRAKRRSSTGKSLPRPKPLPRATVSDFRARRQG
jgi:hypothetical protein